MILLKGVKTHNLKNLDLSLPERALICITGPSGSGKSSLAFDTLFIEARRRYLEALSLTEGRLPTLPAPPPLEEAAGLPPAVGLEQKLPSPSPRSAVGTLSGIWDYLRVLFAELGRRKCPTCGELFEKTSLGELLEELLSHKGARIYVLAPLFEARPKALEYLRSQGFQRFLIDGRIFDLTEEEPPLCFSSCSVLVDRLILKEGVEPRLREALRLAASLAGGTIEVYFLEKKESKRFTTGERCPVCGRVFTPLLPEMFSYFHPLGACEKCQGLGEVKGASCPACKGRRLKSESLNVSLGGYDFFSLSQKPLGEFISLLKELEFSGLKARIFERLAAEIFLRAEALLTLGLSGLELNRPVTKLSLGEFQRLRLASLFAERLSGCLYVLDEPGLGLSPLEKERLLFLLRGLVEQGNTVVVVEHDPSFITASDEVLELGPGAGEKGGELLFQGPPEKLAGRKDLPTGAYLSGARKLHRRRRRPAERFLLGTFSLPARGLLVLCGPSGAGKTSLLRELSRYEGTLLVTPASSKGRESIVISYIDALRPLREIFAATKEARSLGLKASAFSFFTPEGKCPVCKGAGRHEMRVKFLPPLEVWCEECLGTRFRREVLEVRYRGYNIAEILELTVEEALGLFRQVPPLLERLKLLVEVGLSYLRLGQEIKTLSGGERQRLHLARLLLRAPREQVLLFDVPSLGLHLEDLQELLSLFDRLLETGLSLVVADNHPAFVLLADELWEIKDGGPVYQGGPEAWLEARGEFAVLFEKYLSLVDL